MGLAIAPQLSWGLARNPCGRGPLQHPAAESHPLSERREARGRESFALVNRTFAQALECFTSSSYMQLRPFLLCIPSYFYTEQSLSLFLASVG